jgi:hypothetical protein
MAYEEGFDAGLAQSTAAVRDEFQSRLDEATRERAQAVAELAEARAKTQDLAGRLARLTNGARAETPAEAAPSTFQEAHARYGYEVAVQKFPDLYAKFMEQNKKG